MTWDEIFETYYALYRAEADTPLSTDDEYSVALLLAREAIRRWSAYDGVYWKELFTTAQDNSTGGVVTVTAGTSDYAAPTAMKEAGGYVQIKDSDGNTVRRYAILEPQDAQFRADASQYCYFTGDPNNGFTLHINSAPDASIDGMDIDYVYYKAPTELTTGTDKPEMADPMFIVHRVLANRFRVSRNPYYSSAKSDAEEALKVMKMDNDSGTWANPWTLEDKSGSVWGL